MSLAEPIHHRSAGRAERRAAFLTRAGWADAATAPLADDCSYRRYFRLANATGKAVLMDAPPADGEDVRPFVTVARRLRDWGLSAPAILADDPADGFLLIEDLGDNTYTRVLADGGDEQQLYALAIDALIAIQQRDQSDAAREVPDYDDAVLLEGAGRFLDWYLGRGHGLSVPADAREAFFAAWRDCLSAVRDGPEVLVHRDYHVDNLMLLDDRPGVAACGLLDFQDAMMGPAPYDVMSLLQDARRDVAPDVIATMRARYLAAMADRIDPAAFERIYRVLGLQRALRILGVFARQSVLLGNHRYLVHVPRLWRYIDENAAHHAAAPVRRWLDRFVPASAREVPMAGGAG